MKNKKKQLFGGPKEKVRISANSVEFKSVSFIKLNGERIIINFKVFCLTLSESKSMLINETKGTLFYCFLSNMQHAVKPLSSSIHVNKAIRLIS